MKIPLSPRLQACAAMVGQAETVADIGCDHGYLGMYLLSKGQAKHIYAADIRPEPLAVARRNGVKFGLSGHMDFFLCDGAAALPQDMDVLVCAGMGADTMVGILEASPWLREKRLILQCQSKTYLLRQYLSEHGYRIARETAVIDGRFAYTVMEVLAGTQGLTPGQLFISPALAMENSEAAQMYRSHTVDGLRKAVTLRSAPDALLVEALKELEGLQ